MRTQTTQVDDGPALDAKSARALNLRVVFSDGKPCSTSVALHPQATVVVGRDVGTEHLQVNDQRMSRLHFQLVFDHRQGQHRIGDAGSSNGTFLNGQRIKTCVVNPGDVIRAGATLFVVEEPGPMDRARQQIMRVAPTDVRVLLEGETGVGKEVFARRIHELSGRGGPFVAVNCAALSRELAPAEFFGHRKGAFSGAVSARAGLFVSAHQGTLLLDELGELSPELQAMLLRTIAEGTVRPLGLDTELPVNVRLVAATNVTLERLSSGDGFRADLFARLAQVRISIPPLRERRQEVLSLAYRFAEELGSELNLSADAAEALLVWRWPFNIRELRSCVHSFVTTHPEGTLFDRRLLRREYPDLHAPLVHRASSSTLPPAEAAPSNPLANRQCLTQTLGQFNGNVAAAARHLGVERSQIYRWMKRLGVER